ncbi:retron system putative HNH endonuclease [Candidatus Venteria ishoeyi]|uniref:TIGR02646 family protein n=1 Tax=Candidatus Venteria ishoeyi TaxID=1899563 RepID=A0A1H6FB02_9GAMM|nr:retron system putative HNH endonuclease [Candidatus Venteria ishoeyi]MDM8545390.1 retron system putative HNH endonuclease [Candidatus Venteria ishoeyi]SEH07280.1 Uncharacterised protein [Candidatus Venteria ishoeyi]
MRYIHKQAAPDFFVTEIEQPEFDDSTFSLHCKTRLREYISTEQQQLCAYCEAKLEKNHSHLEHMEPQKQNPKRRFDYQNLVASCDGGNASCSEQERDAYEGFDINSCGHRKDNAFDESLFLNPVVVKNIQAHFNYDRNTAEISASELAPAKASYMIDLLHLNSVYLCVSRDQARIAFVKVLINKTPQIQQQMLKQSRPFISFLQACFQQKEPQSK